jgi:hypothetical protein
MGIEVVEVKGSWINYVLAAILNRDWSFGGLARFDACTLLIKRTIVGVC